MAAMTKCNRGREEGREYLHRMKSTPAKEVNGAGEFI